MFTANSMNCLAEVVGMALPGNGTIPAPYSERLRFAKASGVQVMRVLAADLKPRDILTDAAVGNALAADASLGCSTNTVLHLAAIATEAGLEFPLERVNEVAARVPHLCLLAPAGPAPHGRPLPRRRHPGRHEPPDRRPGSWTARRARSPAARSPRPWPRRACPTTRSSARSTVPITRRAAWPCCSATWLRPAPSSKRAPWPPRCCATAARPRSSRARPRPWPPSAPGRSGPAR